MPLNRLISADEGFFCDGPDAGDWTGNCGEGVDTVAFAKLSAIDVLSYHLYPDGWGDRTAQWGAGWIARHNRAARKIGKPTMLGEFGWKDKDTRNPVYRQWTDTFIGTGGAGFLYWILSGAQDDGTPYPDYDGFTVYCPGPVCTTIGNAAREIRSGRAPPRRSPTTTPRRPVARTGWRSPAACSPSPRTAR